MTIRYEVRASIEDTSLPYSDPVLVRYTRTSWTDVMSDVITEYKHQHRGRTVVDGDNLILHSMSVMCVENEP